MIDRGSLVWLLGYPMDVLHVMDWRSGAVVRTLEGVRGDTTAVGGHGRFCAGQFVSLYREPGNGAIWFSVAGRRIPVNSSSHATHRRAPLGMRDDLTVRSADGATLSAHRYLTPRLLLLRSVDVFGSDFDGKPYEYFPIIASFVNEPRGQEHFRKVFDGRQGPWDLLDEGPSVTAP